MITGLLLPHAEGSRCFSASQSDNGTFSGRILWANSLPVDRFHEFLEKLTKKYSLDPWEHGPEPGTL